MAVKTYEVTVVLSAEIEINVNSEFLLDALDTAEKRILSGEVKPQISMETRSADQCRKMSFPLPKIK